MDYLQPAIQAARAIWDWAIPNGLLDLLKALAAPIVAIAALRVSRQQVRINESKLRLDFYDRRLKVYGAVKDLIGAFMANATFTQDDLAEFREGTVEADFLFGKDVQEYIRQMDERIRGLIIEEHRYRQGVRGEDGKIAHSYEKIDELHDWILEQPSAAKAVFQPFLALEPKEEKGLRRWL
ncbi:hypothetical protein [Stenotrophomonas sp. PS02300]|uniref:hypothetical protein n=1 Tax=Stenotrophomonas sp. PS02300 TaxID=2991426 RepID=UPI00249AA48D|nr:hypothetical protein [Stenotrophomonas sp. PS02300]